MEEEQKRIKEEALKNNAHSNHTPKNKNTSTVPKTRPQKKLIDENSYIAGPQEIRFDQTYQPKFKNHFMIEEEFQNRQNSVNQQATDLIGQEENLMIERLEKFLKEQQIKEQSQKRDVEENEEENFFRFSQHSLEEDKSMIDFEKSNLSTFEQKKKMGSNTSLGREIQNQEKSKISRYSENEIAEKSMNGFEQKEDSFFENSELNFEQRAQTTSFKRTKPYETPVFAPFSENSEQFNRGEERKNLINPTEVIFEEKIHQSNQESSYDPFKQNNESQKDFFLPETKKDDLTVVSSEKTSFQPAVPLKLKAPAFIIPKVGTLNLPDFKSIEKILPQPSGSSSSFLQINQSSDGRSKNSIEEKGSKNISGLHMSNSSEHQAGKVFQSDRIVEEKTNVIVDPKKLDDSFFK
jgi:hypothetical protein